MKLTDQEYIIKIREPKPDSLQKIINALYSSLHKKASKKIKDFVRKGNGTKEDAEKIFNDSVAVLLSVVSHELCPIDTPLETLFYHISSRLWRKTSKGTNIIIYTGELHKLVIALVDKQLEVPDEPVMSSTNIPKEATMLEEYMPKKTAILAAIEAIPEEDRELLTLYYYYRLSDDEIATTQKFKQYDEQTIKKKRFTAWKDLQERIIKA